MFIVGDKVVCVDNSISNGTFRWLTLFETYEINGVIHTDSVRVEHITLTLVGGDDVGYNQNRFIHQSEFRRMKIEKIFNKSKYHGRRK